MDNVTHTLTGLVVAEAALALRARAAPTQASLDPRSPAFTRAAWLASALGNNVPDVDFAYAGLTGGTLGNLMHHRGHTHTFALAPLVGLVSLGLARLYARRAGLALGRGEQAFLFGLGLVGAFLHVLLDGLNNYGVHPLWPFFDGWFFGDTIFIVEPLFWLTLAAPLWPTVAQRGGRFALLGIAISALVLSAVSGAVSDFGLALVTLTAAGLAALVPRLRTRGGRAALSLALSALVVGVFASARAVAEVRAQSVLDGAFPFATEVDVVLAPEPGNPACWSALAVAIERDDLVLRRLVVSALPAVHPSDRCRFGLALGESTTAVSPIVRSNTASATWLDEARMPLATLRAEAQDRCDVAAFLRFARAPIVSPHAGARVIADLRYDREPGLGFAEIALPDPAPEGAACPGFLPPWTPPRLEVLIEDGVTLEDHGPEAWGPEEF